MTAFLGVNPTPANRTVRGLAAGMGLIIVGFEFEYANTTEDLAAGAPSLRTFMFNGLLQTPFRSAEFSSTARPAAGATARR